MIQELVFLDRLLEMLQFQNHLFVLVKELLQKLLVQELVLKIQLQEQQVLKTHLLVLLD